MNNKKTINAWCMYDWANSVYSLTVTTAILPPYFSHVTGGENGTILGFKNATLYAYILTASFLTIALLNPILSSIADTGGNRKKFMKFFCYLGVISCSSLYFFTSDRIWVGLVFTFLAAIGFSGSLVFYNAYLPEITSEDNFDRVSAKGFSLGYIGSVILLLINIVFIEVIFKDSGQGPRFSFLSVGLWWFGFAQYSFSKLPDGQRKTVSENILIKGFKELGKVWNELQDSPWIKKFLLSFLLYSMGTQTVMYMATIFGEQVVMMNMLELIILVLILQLVAIGGSFLFASISEKRGNIYSISITLLIWIAVCCSAYFVQEGMKTFFYIIGVFVGLVMGGVQSMSRSTYAKFIPASSTMKTSYYSFYETLEKTSIGLGTFVFGLINQFTGSMRYSAISLSIFFIVGYIILKTIPSKKSYATI